MDVGIDRDIFLSIDDMQDDFGGFDTDSGKSYHLV
jgi:hypothetical protein